MDKKNIIIVTGSGKELGTGHLQRMLNFLNYSLDTNLFLPKIFIARGNYSLPEKLSKSICSSLPNKTDLIIRDMRDSSVEEIETLSAIAPVVVIDDNGYGRSAARACIELLPGPASAANDELFLYGYNFYNGLKSIKKKQKERDIDIFIYLGFNPNKKILFDIMKTLSKNFLCAVMMANEFYYIKNSSMEKIDNANYPEVLLRSKIVATHFGITMFEANLCGSSIIALNPSEYHSELTSFVKNRFDIIYESIYPAINFEDLQMSINSWHQKSKTNIVILEYIIEQIEVRLKNFTKYIYNLI